jgi:hypothetical protein
MKTNKPLVQDATTPKRALRLPLAPRPRFEGAIHLALGLAAFLAVFQFQAVIAKFVPHAPTFAERMRKTPEMLVNQTLALRYVETNKTARTTTPRAPARSGRPDVQPVSLNRGGSTS